MSDWEMRDWRVPPRARYSMAFLGAAVVVSSMILGASMTWIPSVGEFDDGQIGVVADNRLTAVETLWLDEYYISISMNDGAVSIPLEDVFPTNDPTVHWLVTSYFKFAARNKEYDLRGSILDYYYELDGLEDLIDEQFARVDVDGTYCAWELVFNGSTVHFGSGTVDGTNGIPETSWTVSHDYSGEVEWWRGREIVPYRAKLVFHLWFETERPEF